MTEKTRSLSAAPVPWRRSALWAGLAATFGLVAMVLARALVLGAVPETFVIEARS